MKKIFKREKYLSKIRGFYFENDLIKVVAGIRRCGKSSLMKIISDELVEKGVDKNNIIYINLDKRGYRMIYYVITEDLYKRVGIKSKKTKIN